MTGLALTLLALQAVAAPVAVIGVGMTAPTSSALETARREAHAGGDEPLSTSELLLRLVGADSVREPNLEALKGMLADARDRDARFDAAGALALRQEILRAFDTTPRPSAELRQLTHEAMQDWTVSLLAENDQAAARQLAQETWRRFGAAPLDPKRNAPNVRAFVNRVYAEQRATKTGVLHVKSDVPGELWLEARRLGPIQEEARYAVPHGTYRLWLVNESGMSLPYSVHVAGTAQVTVHGRLDAKVAVSPEQVRLVCDDDCDTWLGALRERLGIDLKAVRAAPQAASTLDLSAPNPARATSFNYLSLVPLGAGQLFQERPVAAALVLGTELAALAWHLVALNNHANATRETEPSARTQRNVSALAVYVSFGLGLAEAIFYELALKDPARAP